MLAGPPSGSGIRLAGATNSVHVMDVRSGKWEQVSPSGEAPSPRAAHAAAAVGTMVVIQVRTMAFFGTCIAHTCEGGKWVICKCPAAYCKSYVPCLCREALALQAWQQRICMFSTLLTWTSLGGTGDPQCFCVCAQEDYQG